jgi:transposase
MKVTTIGINLAKNLFQIHGVNERGKATLRKQLKRDQMDRSLPRLLLAS